MITCVAAQASPIDVTIPRACSEKPTPDCIVEALYSPPFDLKDWGNGYILADAAIIFTRVGGKDFAARLAASADEFGGNNELLEQDIAETR